MQKIDLLVASVDGLVGDSANPCLRSETWGTRFVGSMGGRFERCG